MLKVVDVGKASEEILDVLAKNRIPVAALENVFEVVKNLVTYRTYIQNNK